MQSEPSGHQERGLCTHCKERTSGEIGGHKDGDVDHVNSVRNSFFMFPSCVVCTNMYRMDIKGRAHALIAKRGHLARLADTRF